MTFSPSSSSPPNRSASSSSSCSSSSLSSLTQRLLPSPSPKNRHVVEKEELAAKKSKGQQRRDNSHATSNLCHRLIKGPAAMIVIAGAAIGLYWLCLFTEVYNPDATFCKVPTFDYPWCLEGMLHHSDLPPPLTGEEWQQLRHWYVDSLQETGLLAQNSLADDWQQVNSTGFTVPTEIRVSPGKGRGLFATQDISKGTKIWDSRYRAIVPNSCVAKHFFSKMTAAQQCDALFWGYINTFYGNKIQYMLDLDGHGYINHADTGCANAVHHFDQELDVTDYRTSRFFAVATNRQRPGSYGLYAARDISAGEEIVYDYNEIFEIDIFSWHTRFIMHSLPPTHWWVL